METRSIDPGNEFGAPKPGGLPWLIALLRKQPDLNLKTGEGRLLLDEVDRLSGLLLINQNQVKLLQDEIEHLKQLNSVTRVP